MKLFTIIDPKTDEPVAGLANIPMDHPQIMMLIPEKALSRLEVWQRTTCRSRQREVYYVVRTQ